MTWNNRERLTFPGDVFVDVTVADLKVPNIIMSTFLKITGTLPLLKEALQEINREILKIL